MQFSLNTIVIKPEKNVTINNAVILLHGYGGDAKDISMLTLIGKDFCLIQFFCVQMLMKYVQLILQVFNGLI